MFGQSLSPGVCRQLWGW